MLRVENLGVAYGKLQVVHDVSLRIAPGEFVGVLGANGAGKTTTLKGIAGILPGNRGQVWLDDVQVGRLDTYRRTHAGLVLVPEGRHLFPAMTVHENLLVSWEAIHGPRASSRDAFDRVFDIFPRLRERSKQLAGSLSGGEQQMVALGRGLLADPRVLLLDEPSLGLAPALCDEVFDALGNLNTDGMAILMVEQDASRAFEVCSRLYVFERGAVSLSGSVDELAEDPRVVEAFLGSV